MENENRADRDHDLLIKLNTKFDSFEKAVTSIWESLGDKMNRILVQMENKADKSDVLRLEASLVGLAQRVAKVESLEHRLEVVEKMEPRIDTLERWKSESDTRKQTLINLGNINVKFWGWFLSIASLIFMLLRELR